MKRTCKACSAISIALAFAVCPGLLCGQGATLKPSTAIQIENTNAAFNPSEVDVPQANPARPTVTIPAHIPPTGYLQFEQGIVRARNSPGGTNGQLSVSQVTKIALTTRLFVQFLSQPYAYSALNDGAEMETHSSDPGDLQLGAQLIVYKHTGGVPTASVGFIRRVRAGTSASLDTGGYSQSALVLLGGDVKGGFHYDSNLLFNEQNNGPVRHLQLGQTLAVTHALFPVSTAGRLGGTVEFSHFTQPFIDATSSNVSIRRANACDLLFVGTYTFRPNLIFDASVARGLTSTSTHWQGGFGLSYLLPHRLWKDRHPVAILVAR